MIKNIILSVSILVAIIVGVGWITRFDRVIRYQGRFDKWDDSCNYYQNQFLCCFGKDDNASNIAHINSRRSLDSLSKYYALMYPNKVADKTEEKPSENCTCK